MIVENNNSLSAVEAITNNPDTVEYLKHAIFKLSSTVLKV